MIAKLFMVLIIVFTPETLPEDPGTYLVEYTYVENRRELKTMGYVTIVDKNTVINETIAIDAQDFSVSKEENIDEETVLLFSEAKAWNVTTLEEYEIERVEISKIDEFKYNATLYSFDNINTTITITVTSVDLNGKLYLESQILNINDDSGESYQVFRIIGFLLPSFILFLYVLLIILGVTYNRQLKNGIDKLQAANANVKNN